MFINTDFIIIPNVFTFWGDRLEENNDAGGGWQGTPGEVTSNTEGGQGAQPPKAEISRCDGEQETGMRRGGDRNQGMQAVPRARADKGTDCPLEPPEGHRPCRPVDFSP